jgi:hypothetical protein
MDIHSLARHVDFNNPVSWLALYAALLTTAGTVLNLVKALRDRSRLRVEAIVQGRHRAWSPDEARAEVGDFVTLTLLNSGPNARAVLTTLFRSLPARVLNRLASGNRSQHPCCVRTPF